MMMNKIVSLIEEIIEAVKDDLPADNIMDARELLSHDEWGESLSLIYTQLYEYDIPVSEDVFKMIESAGNQMNMDNQGWKDLTIVRS